MAQVSKKFNAVERDQILTELIKKEERQARLSEVFTVPDPRRMTLLPAKPNATTPADRPSEAQLAEAEATLSRLAGIKHAHQVPTQYHQLPATANMEYGFYAASLPEVRDDPMFVHYAGQSDVTRYASSYVQLTGRSPFMRGAAAGGGGDKKH